MKLLFTLSLAAALTSHAFAGALVLEVANPDTNTQARALHALVVARVTACHEPAKSTVTASVLRWVDGRMQRTKLDVVALAAGDIFAVVGSIPGTGSAVVELAVTNPEYKNYEPRVLIRRDAGGLQWASAKRFFSVPPTSADFKAVLE